MISLQVAGRLSEFRDLVKEVVRSACRTALLEAGFTPDDYYMADDGANSPGLGQYNDLLLINTPHTPLPTVRSLPTRDISCRTFLSIIIN